MRLIRSGKIFNLRKSSRNRRKAERKKWSLKEGSSLEDLAIIEQLALLLKQMNTLSGNESSIILYQLCMLYHVINTVYFIM